MLNGNTSELSCENAHSLPHTHRQYVLKVGLDTGCCALSRLANLMAKLDIEPGWLHAEMGANGNLLEITIDFGADAGSMERLVLRLSGMVCVRSLEPGAAGSGTR